MGVLDHPGALSLSSRSAAPSAPLNAPVQSVAWRVTAREWSALYYLRHERGSGCLCSRALLHQNGTSSLKSLIGRRCFHRCWAPCRCHWIAKRLTPAAVSLRRCCVFEMCVPLSKILCRLGGRNDPNHGPSIRPGHIGNALGRLFTIEK